MNANFQLNHAWKYTLLCAIDGAIVGTFMAFWAFPGQVLQFGLSVFIGVGSMAHWYHYRKMRKLEVIPPKLYNSSAVFIGLTSHFSSFFMFFLFGTFMNSGERHFILYSIDSFGEFFGASIFFGAFSMIFLFWLSIPLYLMLGFLMRKLDRIDSNRGSEKK